MVKIDDGHAFFNVQFARIALGVDAMEVVEAIGEVAILLHFTEDHSGANGMRRPGGNVKGVARRDRQAFKKSFEAAGFYSRLKLFSIYFGDQTKQESGARIGGDSVPHFRFADGAGRFVLRGVSVIGMHLDGKLIGGEKKFHQERKLGRCRWRCEVGAAPSWRHFLPRLVDGACKRTGFDLRIRSGEPCFTGWFMEICFVGIDGCKGASAPDAEHKFWLDACGLRPHGLSGGFSAREKTGQTAQPFFVTLDGSGVRKTEIAG